MESVSLVKSASATEARMVAAVESVSLVESVDRVVDYEAVSSWSRVKRNGLAKQTLSPGTNRSNIELPE